jgi:hypothetical protein
MSLQLTYRIPIIQIKYVDLVISGAKRIDFFINYFCTARKSQLGYFEGLKDAFLWQVHYFEESILADGEYFLVGNKLAEGDWAFVEFWDEVEFCPKFVVDVS